MVFPAQNQMETFSRPPSASCFLTNLSLASLTPGVQLPPRLSTCHTLFLKHSSQTHSFSSDQLQLLLHILA